MTSTFGAATTSNPRPFKCTDCKVAFRIHGHSSQQDAYHEIGMLGQTAVWNVCGDGKIWRQLE